MIGRPPQRGQFPDQTGADPRFPDLPVRHGPQGSVLASVVLPFFRSYSPGESMPLTSERVLEALRTVRDPDLGKDLVTLGMAAISIADLVPSKNELNICGLSPPLTASSGVMP